MTLDFFREQMARMNGLKFAPADLQTHWEGLHDLPDTVLSAAIGRAVRMRIEFPTPIELRQDADQARPYRTELRDERESPMPAGETFEVEIPNPFGGKSIELSIDRVWHYHCEECSDRGLREFMCGPSDRFGWMTRKPCHGQTCDSLKRGTPTYNHTWVEPCPCADWNPEIKKRKERDAKYAAERASTR